MDYCFITFDSRANTEKIKHMKKLLSLTALLFWGSLSVSAYTPDDFQGIDNDTLKRVDSLDIKDIALLDDPTAMRLDSLVLFTFFEEGSAAYSTHEFIDVDENESVNTDFHDTIYRDRILALDAQTPLALDYNIYVKRYIDVYTKRRRQQVSRMIGLSNYYFPLFEETLDRYNIPLELKYLAIVESALNPLARSRVGATGLWQFMYSTGKLNGLQVSSYIDERSDPLKSTEAACKYLSQLYTIFGDWNLVLAAYNSGPGNVNKAIRRSGGKTNYWEIRPFLPRETAGYVPAFIAVNYIMNHAADHYIYPTEIKPSYFNTDTINIKERISLEQVAELVDVDLANLEFLNPAYRYKVIPKKKEGHHILVLPASKMGLFIANEDSIYQIARNDFAKKKVELPKYVEMNDRIRHRVRSGEFLGYIARKYGVSVRSIKRWNGLRSDNLRVGQRLTIYPRRLSSVSASSKKSSKKSTQTTPQNTIKRSKTPVPVGNYETYRVKNGDSFYSIARNYPGISAQNIMDWNNISNAKRLKPGMSLKIYTGS